MPRATLGTTGTSYMLSTASAKESSACLRDVRFEEEVSRRTAIAISVPFLNVQLRKGHIGRRHSGGLRS